MFLDKIIIYGIIVGITLGVTIGVIIPLVPSDSSNRSQQDTEIIIQHMMAEWDECTLQYGIIGPQVNQCYDRVLAKYGNP